MPIERSKRSRENASESETQGRGDTVIQYIQRAHNERKKTKDQEINVKWKTKRKKSFWKPF